MGGQLELDEFMEHFTLLPDEVVLLGSRVTGHAPSGKAPPVDHCARLAEDHEDMCGLIGGVAQVVVRPGRGEHRITGLQFVGRAVDAHDRATDMST